MSELEENENASSEDMEEIEDVKIDYVQIRNEEFAKWKRRLTNLIHSHTFCGLCLEEGDWKWKMSAEMNVVELGAMHDCTMLDVLQYLFGNHVSDILCSDLLCEECADHAIQSYVFIQKTKKTTRILSTCVQNITENIDQTLLDCQLQNYEKSIICLSLEGIISHETVTKKPDVSLDFGCPKCNRRFATTVGLNTHIENFHNDKPKVKHPTLSIIKCNICDIALLNTELDEHNKTHDIKTWFCSVCCRMFYSTACFDAHIKTVHNQPEGAVVGTCDFCQKTFLDKAAIESHKCKYKCSECLEIPCVHHKYLVSYRNQKETGSINVRCIDCEFTCTKKISMISHINVDHLNRFDNLCNMCGLTFQSKPALRQHKLRYHYEVFQCEHCSQFFGSQNLLDKHKTACSVAERPFSCDVCSTTFVSNQALVDHKANHFAPQLSCKTCNQRFASEIELAVHEQCHKITISCSMCTADFNCNKEYRKHVATHPVGTRHMCRVCDAKFNSQINHRKHIKWHSKSLEKGACPVCSRQINVAYLKAHIRTHVKQKGARKLIKKDIVRKFECDLCLKKFVSHNVMRRHREIHKEHIPCDICKKLVKPTYMERHLELHSGVKRSTVGVKKLNCDKCDYETIFPPCLESHINRVHLKVRPYRCDICGKGFLARNYLYEHGKIHDKNNGWRKKCPVCGRMFANGQCLKKHMRLHTGEKPYVCDTCGMSFVSACRRNDHINRRHTSPTEACPICHNMYHTLRTVRQHIKTAHCNIRKKDDVFVLEELPEEHRYIFKDKRHPENTEVVINYDN